jgi:hypothetical protein
MVVVVVVTIRRENLVARVQIILVVGATPVRQSGEQCQAAA